MLVNDFERNALMQLAEPISYDDGPPIAIHRGLPLGEVCVRLAKKGLVTVNYAAGDARPYRLTLAGQAVLYSGAGGPPAVTPSEVKR